jgi:hypothetical protein
VKTFEARFPNQVYEKVGINPVSYHESAAKILGIDGNAKGKKKIAYEEK